MNNARQCCTQKRCTLCKYNMMHGANEQKRRKQKLAHTHTHIPGQGEMAATHKNENNRQKGNIRSQYVIVYIFKMVSIHFIHSFFFSWLCALVAVVVSIIRPSPSRSENDQHGSAEDSTNCSQRHLHSFFAFTRFTLFHRSKCRHKIDLRGERNREKSERRTNLCLAFFRSHNLICASMPTSGVFIFPPFPPQRKWKKRSGTQARSKLSAIKCRMV